jgi:putative oxidoreductase
MRSERPLLRSSRGSRSSSNCSAGWAVLLGALIPLASVPMAVVLAVAVFTVHLPNGFSSIKLLSVDAAGAHFGPPGYETDLLYLAGLVALVLGGPGPWALDSLLFRKTPNWSRLGGCPD